MVQAMHTPERSKAVAGGINGGGFRWTVGGSLGRCSSWEDLRRGMWLLTRSPGL